MIMLDLFQNKNCWSTAIVSWMCDDLYIRVHEYIPTIARGGVNYDKDVHLAVMMSLLITTLWWILVDTERSNTITNRMISRQQKSDSIQFQLRGTTLGSNSRNIEIRLAACCGSNLSLVGGREYPYWPMQCRLRLGSSCYQWALSFLPF